MVIISNSESVSDLKNDHNIQSNVSYSLSNCNARKMSVISPPKLNSTVSS